MKDLINKANVLVEALPYIQRFRNSIVVIKFGGSSMEDPELVRSTMRDIVLVEAKPDDCRVPRGKPGLPR